MGYNVIGVYRWIFPKSDSFKISVCDKHNSMKQGSIAWRAGENSIQCAPAGCGHGLRNTPSHCWREAGATYCPQAHVWVRGRPR